jgi:hypothetical protein
MSKKGLKKEGPERAFRGWRMAGIIACLALCGDLGPLPISRRAWVRSYPVGARCDGGWFWPIVSRTISRFLAVLVSWTMASFQACCVSSPGLRAYARAALFAARRAAMHSTVIASLSMTGAERPNAYRDAMVWSTQ